MRSRNLENIRIRLLIMLIAALGGIGFLGYLLFTISAANENENRIAALHHTKFPVIEELLRLKRDVANVHESFSAALALENYLLLEDTYTAATNFSDRVGLINELEPATEIFTFGIQESFVDYYESAKSIAHQLIEEPDKSAELVQQMQDVNRKLASLNTLLVSAIQVRKQEYQGLLEQTDMEMKKANNIGVVLGVLLVVGLVALAWWVSVMVVMAVNRSNKLKEIFLATMSHELRTPINGIAGAIKLLKQTELTSEQATLVDACYASEAEIMTTVDDILEFSCMMSGKLNLTNKAFCVRDAVVKTIELFSAQCREKKLDLQLQSDVDDSLYVLGDEKKFVHALRHLISNAVKFSRPGVISVQLFLEQDTNSNSLQIEVCIHDNGPGISQGSMDIVFEPFRQIDGSFSRQHQGVGIGLSICRNLARAMGGMLFFETDKRVDLQPC